MKRDDSPRHQIQWDILGFIGLIVAALITAGVAIWQTQQSRTPLALIPSSTKSEGTEYVVLPRQVSEDLVPVPGWNVDVWSNASSVQVQGGCARLWRDLSWKDGPRDYLLICDERRNLEDSPGWNDQIKEIEVECTSENAVTVTLWESANFTGGQWQHTFCVR
jgi:hypothetical protein